MFAQRPPGHVLGLTPDPRGLPLQVGSKYTGTLDLEKGFKPAKACKAFTVGGQSYSNVTELMKLTNRCL